MDQDKICKFCQYRRDPHPMYVADGFWCSNSESPKRMTKVEDTDTCDKFYKRGKKAPIPMRVTNKVMGKVLPKVDEILSRRKRKRKH